MEKEKGNNGLVALVIILALLVLGLSAYIVYDKVLDNKKISADNNTTSNNVNNDANVEGNNHNSNNSNTNQEKNNDITENDYIRQTSLILVEEPNCTGQHSTSLRAEINSNKNIAIAQDKGAEEIIVGNAKYLYKVGIIACDNVKLYYITEDNGLYVVDHPSTGKPDQKGTKVTSSKIVEFLGEDHRDDGAYLKVLTEDKKIEYIKYFTAPDYSS